MHNPFIFPKVRTFRLVPKQRAHHALGKAGGASYRMEKHSRQAGCGP